MIRSIKRILIANRGEIACRVIRTCKRLGIETIAVTSEVDRDLPHVKLAEYAAVIGVDVARDSYLNIAKVIAVAKQYQVDAVHPGYGFLSENADFADALVQAGICFIGPSAKAIRAMGSKSEAKAIAQEIAVPVIKGYMGEEQGTDSLLKQARDIGFPILIKATHGGGGKGMRLVKYETEFAAALESCQREASGAFGNATVMLERFVENPRHIELQIFGDSHGNAIVLSERDCSLQRRHQKIIEEAPAPGLSDELRQQLTMDAIAIAKAVDYQGAGTVEFLVDSAENYYFLEMNTRLQVEHPVTEEILGLDLVEWQIRIAAGEPLPLAQNQIQARGHAIEVRLYAEDPEAGFLPSTGHLKLFQMPELAGCRVDAGYAGGNTVSIFYDPMIAKIIVKGDTRQAAIQLLEQALLQTNVQGVKTNQKFLLQLLQRPEVRDSHPDVGFLDHILQDDQGVCFTPLPTAQDKIFAGLIAWHLSRQADDAAGNQALSPWAIKDDWRHGGLNAAKLSFTLNGEEMTVVCRKQGQQILVQCDDDREEITSLCINGRQAAGIIQEQVVKVDWTPSTGNSFIVCTPSGIYELGLKDADHAYAFDAVADKQLSAPMPGRVISVLATRGQAVETGAPLLILEAMKMEHTIRAPFSGTVENIFYGAGDFVEEGAELASVKVDS